MSAVIADPAAAGGAVTVKRGKKKLLIIIAGALVLLLLVGAGTVVYLKKKAHAAAEAANDEDGGSTAAAPAEGSSHEAMSPPTYLPLDPFVVNLADRDSDRYAQVGITLEVESSVAADQMRAYMPAIRNAILMVITRKTSRELLDPMGKEQLADEIAREAVRPMGIDIPAPQPVTVAPALPEASAVAALAASAALPASGVAKMLVAEAAASHPKKAKPHGPTPKNPIRHVNFSSFIIQ
jgi:flagellar FliL protein